MEDLLFHIEKNAVTDFSRNERDIMLDAKYSVHEYVCSSEIVEVAKQFKIAADNAKKTKGKVKDYSACVELLKRLKELFEEGCKKTMPNYFAFAYYLTFGHGEELPTDSVEELNKFLRKYLDDNFMLAFIDDVKKALLFSHKNSIDKKQIVIDAIAEKERCTWTAKRTKNSTKPSQKSLVCSLASLLTGLRL